MRCQTTLNLSAVCLAVSVLAATGHANDAQGVSEVNPGAVAIADIIGCRGEGRLGRAVLTEQMSGEGIKLVRVNVRVDGLPPGRHALHIHETGTCEPCGSAGGHFDPGPEGNPSTDGNHPFHMGDLVNLDVSDSGEGRLRTVTTRITLSPGPLSVFDSDGSAFIIHDFEDTFCPDGAVVGCAGGSRAACGIINPL